MIYRHYLKHGNKKYRNYFKYFFTGIDQFNKYHEEQINYNIRIV